MNHRHLVAQCMEELRLKTAAHDGLWHLGNADWSVEQDTGEIAFSTPDGVVAKCPVQIIGTFDTNDSTWLCAWDHPSVRASLRNHAAQVREYGESSGVSELTTRKLSATEQPNSLNCETVNPLARNASSCALARDRVERK